MPGHGNLMHRLPLTLLPSISLPFSSTSTGCTPGRGRVAKLGFVLVMPASGDIMMPPVSVCHQVSTIGQRFLPMCSSNQCHASSFIGSPTEPNFFSELRSWLSTLSKPKLISERMAVGAVYKILTLYLSTISQKRPQSGQVGMPSNISVVAPCESGPYTM